MRAPLSAEVCGHDTQKLLKRIGKRSDRIGYLKDERIQPTTETAGDRRDFVASTAAPPNGHAGARRTGVVIEFGAQQQLSRLRN
jgi:hypothetical protein